MHRCLDRRIGQTRTRFLNKERHAEKVGMLAAALVKRYGRSASKFVAQQVIESDDANRATWLAVMEALPD